MVLIYNFYILFKLGVIWVRLRSIDFPPPFAQFSLFWAMNDWKLILNTAFEVSGGGGGHPYRQKVKEVIMLAWDGWKVGEINSYALHFATIWQSDWAFVHSLFVENVSPFFQREWTLCQGRFQRTAMLGLPYRMNFFTPRNSSANCNARSPLFHTLFWSSLFHARCSHP